MWLTALVSVVFALSVFDKAFAIPDYLERFALVM